jgi:response regulator RpfG family c-di-GMP phosphodiesterase
MPNANKHPILLVDDEPEILFSLRGLLRREFELHTAERGAQALEILRQHPIHVIMSDQRMPEMTGVELLRRARAEFPQAIRILFTGYADIKSVIEAINEARVYRYLTKPWDPDELCALLHEACGEYDRIAQHRDLLQDLRGHLARCQALPDGQADQDRSALLARLDQALSIPEQG